MEIKRMTVADSKKIQDFCEFDNFWNRYIFQQDIQSPNALYYQVVEQEEIVGILGASRILDVIEIRNIAVKKNKRGQGIGTKLLQHCKKYSRKEVISKTRISNGWNKTELLCKRRRCNSNEFGNEKVGGNK